MTTKPAGAPWRNRIVGYGEEPPEQLVANPANFRAHPRAQQDALAGVLGEIGWIDEIIVNRRTGRMVNGHLRVALAIQHREPVVPVKYVDLDEAEERLALATFDPISAMATIEQGQLDGLLHEVSSESAAVQTLFAGLAKEAGLVYGETTDGGGSPRALVGTASVDQIPEQFSVLVECDSEQQQVDLLEQLQAEGYSCRALMS